MHASTLPLMEWICRAGGQVTPDGLAYWRYPWRQGQREARRKLAELTKRGWLVRHGSERYPVFGLSETGVGMCGIAGIECIPPIARTVRPSARHDQAVAAILERAKALGLISRWWAAHELTQPDSGLGAAGPKRKMPDALALTPNDALLAVELEASKKGGALRGGRSNWASTVKEARERLEERGAQRLLVDGLAADVTWTLFIALSPLLTRGLAQKLGETDAYWLVGDRIAMQISKSPGHVDLDLAIERIPKRLAPWQRQRAAPPHDDDDEFANEPILEDL
jgi:hypothetical protein